MTQDEIIRMAREANDYANKVCRQDTIPREWRLVRDVCFAALVAAHERDKQVEQEPVAIADGTFNHNCPLGTPLYAAPVRTKDLTDDEILSAPYWGTGNIPTSMINFARSVIAADREKNK